MKIIEKIIRFVSRKHKCMFCKEYLYCRREWPKGSKTFRWWDCDICDVSFQYHDLDKEMLKQRFIRTINDKETMLFIAKNYTELYIEEQYNDFISVPTLSLTFPFPLQGINPQNAESKIKKLIVFS